MGGLTLSYQSLILPPILHFVNFRSRTNALVLAGDVVLAIIGTAIGVLTTWLSIKAF